MASWTEILSVELYTYYVELAMWQSVNNLSYKPAHGHNSHQALFSNPQITYYFNV